MDRAQALLLIGIKVSLSRDSCLHALPPLERIPTQARTILELGCDIEAVVAGINHAQRQVHRLKPNRTRLACTTAHRDQSPP